jgi:hypothetical protein
MSSSWIGFVTSILALGVATPVYAQVVEMEPVGTATCQYLKGRSSSELVCNITATQTFANAKCRS